MSANLESSLFIGSLGLFPRFPSLMLPGFPFVRPWSCPWR